jgi:prefoldin subunit 5
MTEEERTKAIAVYKHELTLYTRSRDLTQSELCKIVSRIEEIRAKLRDLGYQAPTATGA